MADEERVINLDALNPADAWGHPVEWPDGLSTQVGELLALDSEDIEGQARLGDALAFKEAPAQIEEIREILRDLSEEDWLKLGDQFHNDLVAQMKQLMTVLREMADASSGQENIHALKPDLEARLTGVRNFFRDVVGPRTVNARARRIAREEIARSTPETPDALREELRAFRLERDELQGSIDRLKRDLEGAQAVVEAGRDAASVSGAQDLAKDYARQAADHEAQWKTWGKRLIAALVLALVLGPAVILVDRPGDDASSSQIVGSVTLDLLIVGLLIYLIRIASHQFSVHRHLAAVAMNKAAALSTFSRIVAGGSDAESRTAIATVLAQSVFSSDDTGFIDATGNQVTLIERIAAPIAQRVPGPS